MTKNTGARYEIAIDGTPRMHERLLRAPNVSHLSHFQNRSASFRRRAYFLRNINGFRLLSLSHGGRNTSDSAATSTTASLRLKVRAEVAKPSSSEFRFPMGNQSEKDW